MKLTVPLIVAACGASNANATLWLQPLQAMCDRFAIDTPLRVAAYLPQIGVESGGLNARVENFNYSAQGLADTWPNRYAVDPKAKVKTPNSLALRLNRNPVAIANNCYAGRLGNGDEASGDGWQYRGRGPIQITGRSNYTACAKAIGLDLLDYPELLEQPMNGALAAGWFWQANGLAKYADARQVTAMSKVINLGNANSKATPLGLDRRLAGFSAACKVLGV
jgi:putative chitinase